MRTKIVYVLVSQETDYYYEMFLLSHYSLRLHHPKGDAEVVLVMDTDTHQRLVDKKASVLDDVTPVVVSIPEEYTIMQRSRYLKTSLRQRIEGDFLYLDTDTLVCKSIEKADYIDANIAMVANYHDLKSTDRFSLDRCKQAGFQKPETFSYFNSGIIYSKDSELTQSFFSNWHELWKTSVQKEIPFDQPSLWATNQIMNYPILEISGIWNCQLMCPLHKVHAQSALILHYYISSRNQLFQKYIFEFIKRKGCISKAASQIAHQPYTTGISFFSGTMSDERFIDYSLSDLLHVYDYTPPAFRILTDLSYILVRPVRLLSKLKLILQGVFTG